LVAEGGDSALRHAARTGHLALSTRRWWVSVVTEWELEHHRGASWAVNKDVSIERPLPFAPTELEAVDEPQTLNPDAFRDF
jgi:hypothetical protein